MRNTTEVATLVDKQGTWIFCVPSEAENIPIALDTFLQVYDGLVAAFDDFVLPEEATVHLKSRHENASMKNIQDVISQGKETDEIEQTIRAEDGVTTQHLRDTIPDKSECWYFIQQLSIDNPRVRFRLADSDVYANTVNNSAVYSGGTRSSSTAPSYPPLEFLLLYAKNFDEDDVEADVLIYIFVSTWTDIWFEDTEIGRVNRDRLRDFLTRVERELPVAKVNRESTRWEDEMADIF